jgi:hypothetical protein
VKAFDFRDSILNDFCFFKSGTSNWNYKNKYINEILIIIPTNAQLVLLYTVRLQGMMINILYKNARSNTYQEKNIYKYLFMYLFIVKHTHTSKGITPNQPFFLCPNCIPEEAGVYQRGTKQQYSHTK